MAYKKISGIYKITSPSSKVYIGKSVCLKSRINSYKNVNNLHRHKNQVRLYNSFKKYGVENHVIEIIEECEESELYCRERYWQEYYSSTGSLGLNCMLTECKEHGRVISEEVRKKLSERMSGENNPMFGVDWTENKTEDEIKEWKDKISKTLKGRVFTEEHKRNLRGKTDPTIDLISIGIVCEDGREFYAISKDFNLKEAWNRYDIKVQTFSGDLRNQYPSGRKQKKYWIRENVLKPIFMDLLHKFNPAKHDIFDIKLKDFTYRNLSKLIKKYGKTNKQIAQEVKNFCYLDKETRDGGGQFVSGSFIPNKYPNIELYGYYSAYDHVALCWLFGKMIDLPTGFPMYTIDLKQMLDEAAVKELDYTVWTTTGQVLEHMKTRISYPKQANEHNALSDAKWNFELYKFLNN